MAVHVIIDGYNLIRQTPVWRDLDAQDLQWGREALLESLAAYRRVKKHPITVVFDGTGGELLGQRDFFQGILILYSRQDETADEVIKRLVARERERGLVVTSDREIIDYALRVGAAVMSAPEFACRLQLATGGAGLTDEEEVEAAHPQGTKKKGPAHRAPKKLRRLHGRLKKI